MANLMGTSDVYTNPEILDHVKTPRASGRHFPVPHSLVRQHAADVLTASKYDIVEEEVMLAKENQRAFGIFVVKPPLWGYGDNGGTAVNHSDLSMVLGWRNSHDKSFSAGLVLGSRVMVCDNLAFYGEYQFRRKHTRNIRRDLGSKVYQAFIQATQGWQEQTACYQRYKQTELTRELGDHIIMEAASADVIPASKALKVRKEWREPRHPEFKEPTAWTLFNAFTETLKDTSVLTLPRRTMGLHHVMDAACMAAA